MTDNNNDIIFFGSKESYNDYKKKNHIEDDPEDNESGESTEESQQRANNSIILDRDHLTDLDEETFNMLRRTRIVHKDYDTVYMQSSMDFYDKFYHDTEIPQVVMDALNIRRVYKKYPDFLKAMEARENYISYIIEKHGGIDAVNRKMAFCPIDEYMPPKPILSKKCPEYELYVSGIRPDTEEGISDEEFKKLVESYSESAGDNLIITGGVLDNKGMLDFIEDQIDEQAKSLGLTGRKKTVSFNDLNELQRIFDSWYTEDDNKNNNNHPEFFRNSPENIRKRFMDQRALEEPNLLYAYSIGKEPDDQNNLDPNEMVVDPVTNKVMPRKKVLMLEQIRELGKYGWSEKRLRDYRIADNRLKRHRKKRISRKRGRRNSTDFLNGALGATGIDPMYSDNESIADDFMKLMRG